jgi:hypothetical protein
MNKTVHLRYWNESDHLELKGVSNFKQLGAFGLAIIGRTPGAMHMASGPISTGGVGSVEGNMHVLGYAIDHLAEKLGLPVFSQMPFEPKMAELAAIWAAESGKTLYCMPILEDFYEGVFSSGKVVKVHFVHGWESSFGAGWEHEGCLRWKIERAYLPEALSLEALEAFKQADLAK